MQENRNLAETLKPKDMTDLQKLKELCLEISGKYSPAGSTIAEIQDTANSMYNWVLGQ